MLCLCNSACVCSPSRLNQPDCQLLRLHMRLSTRVILPISSLISRGTRILLPTTMSSRAATSAAEESIGSKTGTLSGPKVLVLGGSGYVGSHVLQAVLARGGDAVSINRSGKPTGLSGSWLSQVKWVSADIFDGSTWAAEAQGAAGVISCVGAFGSNEFMEKINGDANIRAAQIAAEAGAKNYVYISTVESNLPSFVLSGYFNGKRRAERAILEQYPNTGFILRPSFIYGTRQVGGLGIPLSLAGKPLDFLFRLPPFPSLRTLVPGGLVLFAPPVSVDTVATVAAAAALGEKEVKPGFLPVDAMVDTARRLT